jgi:hypothetical protein
MRFKCGQIVWRKTTKCVGYNYGKKVLCCVQNEHGKGTIEHGEDITVFKHTAKIGTVKIFAVCIFNKYMTKIFAVCNLTCMV